VVLDLFFQTEKPCLKPEESISVILRAINSQNNGGLARLRWYSDRHYNKVDKVSGERLINADEIVKLSNQSIQTQETKT
jgi:hypothetical protein